MKNIKLFAEETASLHGSAPLTSFYNEDPTTLYDDNKVYPEDEIFIKFPPLNIDLDKRYVYSKLSIYVTKSNSNIQTLSPCLFFGLLPKNYDIKDRIFSVDYIGGLNSDNTDAIKNPGWVDMINPDYLTYEDILRGFVCRIGSDGNYPAGFHAIVSITCVGGGESDMRPILEIGLNDPNIKISNFPASGFINEKEENILSWEWETDSIGGNNAINAIESTLEWKNGADGEVQTVKITGGSKSYRFPANTFPETSTLLWRVTVDFAEGYTAESDWATLTTIDATPTVEIISPKSVYIDGSIENIFSWDYDISTGSAQYGAVLQYSDNNGLEWKSLGTVTGASTTYTVPANTLPAGTILWKVQAANSDGGTSEWSEPATVVVRSAPPVPVVSVSGASPRPIISWQALGQQAYQVQIGGYDSGEMYGTNKSYKVPEFLPDGPAIARVRIQNSFGIWSEWGTAEFTVANVEIGSCVAKATGIKNWIRVSWDFVAEAERIATFYIYRDNALIGKTTDSFFDDQLAWGAHAYKIRCAAGDYYAMSNEVKAKLDIKTACIAEYGVWDWLELPVVRGRLPALSTQYTGNVTYLHFAGRTLPVAEIGEERDVSWSFAFSTTNRECAERMASLFARLVVYKDPRDGACVGVLEGQSRQSDRYGWDFSYTIRAVDHKEVVTYDV